MGPLTLLVKPAAGLCNLRCTYCFYTEACAGRQNKCMDAATADALIQKIRVSAPSRLNVLFQGGEPLLAGLPFFRDFVRNVRAAAGCPVSFGLQTNGVLLDEAFAAFFAENGFLVGVSLDGDRALHDRYRRTPAGESVHAQVLEAADRLKAHGADFNILSVVTDESAAHIGQTYEYFKSLGFGYLQFLPCMDVCGVGLTAENYAAFLKASFDLWYDDLAQGRYVSVRHIDNYIRILLGEAPENCAMCGVCGGYFVVEADGSVYPCDFYCTEEYKLGTVFDGQPFSIGEKHRSFIARSRVIHASCSECEYHFLCRGGCLRDRTADGKSNRYCAAYKQFFAYAGDRLRLAAETFA